MRAFAALSLRMKLALVMTALLAVISLGIFAYFPARLRAKAIDAISTEAATLTDMAAYGVAPGLFFEDRIGVEEALTAVRQSGDLVYLVVADRSGQPFAAFNQALAEQYHFAQAGREGRPEPVRGSAAPAAAARGSFSADESVFQISTPVRYNGREIGRIFLGLSLQTLNTEIRRSRQAITVISLVVFLLGLVFVFALSAVITEPLSLIARTAEQIARGDLGRRTTVPAAAEVGQLARSFNTMVDRLEVAHRELAALNQDLERRVEERTRELMDEVEERKRVGLALRESERHYRLLFERNLAGVYVGTLDGRILDCNDACARILGYESREAVLAGPSTIPYADAEDRAATLRRLHSDGMVADHEVELRVADRPAVWVLENVRLVRGTENAAPTLEGIFLDVTDRKRVGRELEFRALHDSLTGLPNRTLLKDRLAVALALARRTRVTCVVMFLDLDDFKGINDTLGHAIGDKLLQLYAGRLRESLREVDTVARVGGDEFLVLLPEVDGPEAASAVAQKLQLLLAEPFFVEDIELHVTTSIGIALYPMHGEDAEDLLKSADAAMYRVKEVGGRGFQLSGQTARPTGMGRLSLEQELRQALERHEFEVHYQPQADTRSGVTVGLEALVRWRHPGGTLVEPAGFIAAAEYTGLIVPIGEWVLHEACRQMSRWDALGLPPIRLAVNISARQIHQRDFPGVIERALSAAALPADRLELEITESIAVLKSSSALRTLQRLKQVGVRIAIDDFGTGQSSLSYLKRFPIDTLKIDQSFVAEMAENRNVESIVVSILYLARLTGLRTIAEGVERESQRTILLAHDCDECQGYLFGRPQPAEAARSLLTRPELDGPVPGSLRA